MADAVDVLIVGGGPAGQAAALELAGRGASIAMVDEQQRPGGQILRQPPARFTVANWLPGSAYRPLHAQLAAFEKLDLAWHGGHSVLDIAQGQPDMFDVDIAAPLGGVKRLEARRVLIAAGCQDLAVPLPGWTKPGVYAAGGIQAFIKSQQIIPGDRIVLAGTHPLLLVIAAQIVEAGGRVEALLFAQPRAEMMRALLSAPVVAARHIGPLLPGLAAMRTLRRHGVAVHFGRRIQAILGDDRVEAVVAGGRQLSCDAVGLAYGFVPQSALPRMTGARMRRAGRAGGWAAIVDRWMQSSVPGLFAAGETTGVAGAPAAMASGTIAGTGIALDLGLIDERRAERASAAARESHASLLRFADLLDRIADPHPYFPSLAPETLVCRCEDVPLAQISPLLTGRSANAIKLATRCGMGVCQGRNCEPTLLRLIDDRDDPGFAARFPARPVTIADLAAPL